jgi:hypothetical protein
MIAAIHLGLKAHLAVRTSCSSRRLSLENSSSSID